MIGFIAEQAKIGLPEVGLGVFPGWGGTVRLPRIIAAEIAANWIATGKPQNAKTALSAGAVSNVCSADDLLQGAIAALDAIKDDFLTIRDSKSSAVNLSVESKTAIDELLVGLDKRPGKNFPAGSVAVNSMLSQLDMELPQACTIEATDFSKLIKTDTAINLLSVFLNQQSAAKAAKNYARAGAKTESVGVIGAGIMGGGIAYQSALKNIPAVMKDINQEALDLGLDEAKRNFSTLVKKGRLDAKGERESLNRINATLENDDLKAVDTIVEAVVENINVKKSVLSDLEDRVDVNTVISSNTSTISITRIAEALKRPGNFAGMHFFNPVPVMPLVEIIRGKQTSVETISKLVAFTLQLGKNPVVVNDCPGFLVNRVLFPYINAAHMLINEGVDFQQLDAVMEAWGWPMGPAYLSDVIGMDTMVHCLDVMATDIPERMSLDFESASQRLYNNDRMGQKNGLGYYSYSRNETGRMAKLADKETIALLYKKEPVEINAQEIEERLMLAICFEMVRCIEEEVVASAAEADMALIWGLGFPTFRGGVLRHIDTVGVEEFCNMAEKYSNLGPLYEIPQLLNQMRNDQCSFYD